MTWSDFYDNYIDWADSTIRSRISSLEDIGTGGEIADVILDLSSEKARVQLIRKAIRLNAKFSHDDFMNLEDELPNEVYRDLAAYAGFDASDPYLDENNLTWDDFYSDCCDWSGADTLRRIGKLKSLGPADEVCEVICEMPNSQCKDALYRKALTRGVRFSENQLIDMGYMEDVIAGSDGPEPAARFRKPRKGPPRGLVLGLAILGALSSPTGRRHNTHLCNGDCANCSPHYGYRYGRWYHGHGHQHGCQRGGNGGASGKTFRD